jgi:hypothetical protein
LRKALKLKLETDIGLDPKKMVQADTGRHQEKRRELASLENFGPFTCIKQN